MSSCVLKTSEAITSIAISRNFLIAGTLEGNLKTFEIINDNHNLRLRGIRSFKSHQSSVSSIAISNQLLVTASRDGEIQFHLRDGINTKEPAKLQVSEREIPMYNVSINQLENKVIACCENGDIIHWDTSRDEGDLIFHSDSSSILTGQFSPNSPFVFTSADSEGVIRIHDLRENASSLHSSKAGESTCPIRTLTHLSGGDYVLYATLNDTGKDDLVGLYDVRKKSPVDTTLCVNSGGLSSVTASNSNEAFLSHESGLLSKAVLDTQDVRLNCSSINFQLNLGPGKFASYIDLCPHGDLLAVAGWNSKGGEIAITDATSVHSV